MAKKSKKGSQKPKKAKKQLPGSVRKAKPAKRPQRVKEAVPLEPSTLDLGPVVLPGPEDAVRALKELAVLNDKTIHAHGVFLAQQARTKDAKARWEELAEALQTKLRRFTHPSDLPLFDATEREQDQAEMQASAQNQASAPSTEG